MTPARQSLPAVDVYGRAAVPLPTAAEAAAADSVARAQFGVPARVLMESAARAAALVLHRLQPRGRIVGIAGSGNNGGDLLALMRVLRAWGRDCAVIAVGSNPPDAALLHGDSVEILQADAAERTFARADILVDGMLGTGASGAPRGRVRDWIERMNDAGSTIIALDMPSGVDASSGAVPDIAIRATATVTFGWPKLGLLLHPARDHCGRLIAVEIGFPQHSLSAHARAITSEWARLALRPRGATAHKSSAGRLLIFAGSEGMAGAAVIAVEAAMRAGAGLVRVASVSANREILQSVTPEATFADAAALSPDDAAHMHALVAGPGIGTAAAARAALQRALELMSERPTVLDADALNLLAREPGALRDIGAARPVLITPHPRELSRLTGADIGDILADAPAAARDAARQFHCTVLLKGQPSLVAGADGELRVNTVGSSDVASAGMGDQLAGVIGALLAARHSPVDAASLALFLAGRAADTARLGRALSPRDVSAAFPQILTDLGPRHSPLDLPFITFDQPPRW